MIIRFTLLSAALLAAPVATAQQAVPEETPLRDRLEPLIKDLDDADRSAPQKALPGKLCLVEIPQRCGDKAELIQRPYTGGAELYHLERPPAKPDAKSATAPLEKPPHN